MLSEPVIGKDFFGRSEALGLLNKRVGALTEGYRQNVALTGQNLAGKSSILHHFLHTFSDNRILPIYVEIADEPFSYFARKFIGSLLYNLLRSAGADPKEDFEALLEEARHIAPHTVKTAEAIQEAVKKKNLDSAYSALFDITAAIKEETGKSCVIILDEFHNLASLRVKHPFKNFGKKIMVQKDTMYIVTSSQVTTVRKILNEKLSLLFGNFEILRIKGFSPHNASSFLAERFRYLRMPQELSDFIISFTEGNPFYLDVISQAVRDIVTSMTFKRIRQDVLVDAMEKTIFNSKGCIFQYLNSTLEAVRREKSHEMLTMILLTVARGASRLKDISKKLRKRPGDISRHLGDLIALNILYRNGSFFKFVDNMFGFWLHSVYQKKRSSIISYMPDRVRAFREETGRLVEGFLDEEKKDILIRVSGLLSSFQNDKVQIYEREHRMPAFSTVEIKARPGGQQYILARHNRKSWYITAATGELKEADIIEYAENINASRTRIEKKVILAPCGIEMNARLMAKQEKIWIWSLETVNQLMSCYGRGIIVNYIHREKRYKTA